jgi:hypothetical protein
MEQKGQLRAKNHGDLQSSVISAAFYAKRHNETMFGYLGNSYGASVWRVSTRPSEYLDPINNSGRRVFSVSPDMMVTFFECEESQKS